MNKLELYRGKSLTRKQRNQINKQLREMETYRQIVKLAMESLRDVDLKMVEMVSDTLEATYDLIFKNYSVLSGSEKKQIDELTDHYITVMHEILREHRGRVLFELDRQGRKLERIDPQWKLLLPKYLEEGRE